MRVCGVVAVLGPDSRRLDVAAMLAAQTHRGPDHQGCLSVGDAAFGHSRLRILDLTTAADQPIVSTDGRFTMVFNGEIYNYRELRVELGLCSSASTGDTAVLLAAYARWGADCLDHLVGMFAFVVWDNLRRSAFAARDRFGVKPLYLCDTGSTLVLASEIGAFHAVGLGTEPDLTTWATFLTTGRSEFLDRTFWEDISPLPAGFALTWCDGHHELRRWYDVVERADAAGEDVRGDPEVEEEALALLAESVALRFRSDVAVGVCLSGGLDSSALLALIHESRGADDDVTAFTFTTGDPRYDELPWVAELLRHTNHRLVEARLAVESVPDLAESVHRHVREPFGGLPTLAYANLFEVARQEGVTVLLDGQGLDEAFAGYDYYRSVDDGPERTVQGTAHPPTRPATLTADASRLVLAPNGLPPSRDRRVGMQLRDLTTTKLPRALRYNDRVSMRSSRELREPFLDHRLVELGLAQPSARLVRPDQGKLLVRKVVERLVPAPVAHTPKRPVQTPQREWLRGPLSGWTSDLVEAGLEGPVGALLDADRVRGELRAFFSGQGDNSYFVWQWISAGLLATVGTQQ